MILTGKFIFIDRGETFRTAQIVEKLHDHFYLIQPDDMSDRNHFMPMEVMSLYEFTDGCEECGRSAVRIFHTRAQMDAWYGKHDAEPKKKGKVIELPKH